MKESNLAARDEIGSLKSEKYALEMETEPLAKISSLRSEKHALEMETKSLKKVIALYHPHVPAQIREAAATV